MNARVLCVAKISQQAGGCWGNSCSTTFEAIVMLAMSESKRYHGNGIYFMARIWNTEKCHYIQCNETERLIWLFSTCVPNTRLWKLIFIASGLWDSPANGEYDCTYWFCKRCFSISKSLQLFIHLFKGKIAKCLSRSHELIINLLRNSCAENPSCTRSANNSMTTSRIPFPRIITAISACCLCVLRLKKQQSAIDCQQCNVQCEMSTHKLYYCTSTRNDLHFQLCN